MHSLISNSFLPFACLHYFGDSPHPLQNPYAFFLYLLSPNQASRSVLRATHVNAAKDVANGVAQEDSPTRADFLAARQGGRKWRAWELEALQGAVQAFRWE